MSRPTVIIVGVLMVFFLSLATYAMVFKPRNDRFDESAGRVLSK